MDQTLKSIVQIYHVKKYDWMNYKITKQNPLTYHHIHEKRNGGRRTLENGAPLTHNAHVKLNVIELKYYQLYLILNEMFLLINRQQYGPTPEQRRIIEEVLDYYDGYENNEKVR